MSTWTMFVLENSVVVLVLAVLTESISRATRSDRIANLLWMIVLAKFFLPSFLLVELPLLQPQQSSIATTEAKHQKQVLGIQALDRNQFEIAISIEANKEPHEGSTNEAKTASIKANNDRDNRKTAAEVDQHFAPVLDLQLPKWDAMLCAVWALGSVFWFSLLGLRLWRFRRSLRASYLADSTMQTMAGEIAVAFGLKASPELHIVDVPISPMLWNCGRKSKLILPSSLLRTSSVHGIQSVLAHEIAHLKRLDHWVQRFAMVVLGVFWWHPVSWLAVHRIRWSQDACCDLDVVAWAPELRVAYAETLVDVAESLRFSVPPFALALSSHNSLRDRVHSILQGKQETKLGLWRTSILLVIGLVLASLSARVVAMPTQFIIAGQATSSDDQNPTQSPTSSSSDSTKIENFNKISKLVKDSDARTEIAVLQPDGAIAAGATYVLGSRHSQISLDEALHASFEDSMRNNGIVIAQLRNEGMLPLEFKVQHEFVAIWNATGFYKTAISRLPTMNNIQLQAWGSLQLNVKMDPTQNTIPQYMFHSRTTSDNLHSGMSFVQKASPDADGLLSLPRVSAGETGIFLDWDPELELAKKEQRSIVITPKVKQVMIEAGKRLELTLDHSEFNVDSKSKKQVAQESQQHNTLGPNEIVASNDAFTSGERVAFVSMRTDGEKRFLLQNRNGKLIRELDFTFAADDLGYLNSVVAFDSTRNRLYILSADSASSTDKILQVLDLSGRVLFRRGLPSRCFRIAMDLDSGNLWVLRFTDQFAKRDWNTEVLVLNPQLEGQKTHTLSAFEMCYSPFDKAFWMAGTKTISKVDPDSGQEIAVFKLPTGIWRIVDAIPDPRGGIVAVERIHQDVPISCNRVWRIDTNANPIANVDIGRMYVTSTAILEGDILVRGFARTGGLWDATRNKSNVVVRFNSLLESQSLKGLELTSMVRELNGKQAWGIESGSLKRIFKDENNAINTETIAKPFQATYIWSAGDE